MAKKQSKKKPATKKTTKKASASAAPSKKKPSSKKTATTKAPAKKAPTKKVTKKAAASKPTSKKAPAPKTPSKKAPSKKPASKKANSKKAPAAAKPATNAKDAAKTGSPDTKKKPVRKGITIVSQKPTKKSSKKASELKMPELGGGILGPGAKRRKPLIPSGGANETDPLAAAADNKKKRKSPFNKRQLDKFRKTLLTKRGELIGDVSNLEDEALQSGGGGASQLPQHIAEQGSDVADQSLNLDLAAADRRLIKEIDDALQRIADGVFGLCELSGEPIGAERLEELPWARYSIEAARALERRGG
ncbi:MAG: TraR/DksA C4-type zinc finger protein [Planctomycetota bacterium]